MQIGGHLLHSTTTLQGQLNIQPCDMPNPERNLDPEDLVVLIYLNIEKALAPVTFGKFLVNLEKVGCKAKIVRW